MSKHSLSLVQRIFRKILSKETFIALKLSSLSWRISCRYCHYETNYWEQGGVRLGTATKKATPGKCPQCNRWQWFPVKKIDSSFSNDSS